MLEFLGAVWEVWALLRTVMGSCVMNCAIIHVFVCMRPESAEKYRFTKRTDNLCFERNSNRGFYCSQNSDHENTFS